MKLKLLREKTRYEKETGQKYSPKEDFLSKITVHPVEYAFTMTDIPKVGLNPKTDFNTPAGVYFYPLDQEHYDMLVENQLPFASGRKYCGLVKLNWSDKKKWLIFGSNEKNQEQAAYNEAEKLIQSKMPRYEFDVLKHREHTHGKNQNGKNGIDGRIFDLTYFASLIYDINQGSKSTVGWTKLLRELGYIGLYDYGSGVIHPSEKTQLVCLEPAAYETIHVYETKDLRRGSEWEKENINFRKKQADFRQKQIATWKEFFSQPVENRIYNIPWSAYDNTTVFHVNEILNLGFPTSILEGSTFNCSVVFDFLYKEPKSIKDKKIPDNFTVKGNMSIAGASEMGKNLTCIGNLIIKEGIKQIPQGYDIEANTLKIDMSSNLHTIPNDIDLNNLTVEGAVFSELPENLTVPGNLDISYTAMKTLPKGLSVGKDLKIDRLYKDVDTEEFFNLFPDDLQVGGKIRGWFPLEIVGWEIEWDFDQFKQLLANKRKELGLAQPLTEVYSRWKKLI
jgi:hypothetical protein